MSLQIWLPLNGNLQQQGLSNAIVASEGTVAIDSNGKIGKCYKFGTEKGRLTFPVSIMKNFTNACSIAFWVKINTWNTNYATIFQCGLGGTAWTAYRFGILRNNNNKLHLAISDGTNSYYSLATNDLTLGQWYHICFTYTTGKCSCYVNGIFLRSGNTTVVPDFNGATVATIGAINASGGYQCNMYLNDFRIYDHCLSQKEVEEIAKGLVLHYKLDNNGMGGNNLAIDTANKIVTATATGTDVNSTTALDYGFQSNWANLRGKTITISCDIELINAVNTTGVTNYRVGIEPAIKYTDNTTGYYGIWVALNSTPQTSSKRYSKTVTLPDKDFASMVQNGMYIQHLTNGTATIKNVKVELGSTATPWSPNPTDLGIDSSIVYDSSGYGNDGDLTNNEITSDTARYTSALALNGTTVDNSSNTKAGAAYLRGFLSLPASDALTVIWWGKIAAYGRGGIFQTTSVSDPSECTDYNTTTIANWDSTFRIYNGSNSFNIFSWFKKDNAWHHHAIVFNGSSIIYYCDGEALVTTAFTGPLVAFNGFCMGLGKAGGVYRQIKQTISDLRIYVTGLSSEAVLELYHTSATIDNTGNIHARELVE